MRKITNIQKICILFSLIAVSGLMFFTSDKAIESATQLSTNLNKPSATVSAAKLREIETSIAAMESFAANEKVQGSLGRVNLNEANSTSRMALAAIRGGLQSGDKEVVELSSTYAESIFVMIAHGEKVDPIYRNDIHSLFLVYDKYGQDQIRQMRKAFPASPTLAYLQKLKGN